MSLDRQAYEIQIHWLAEEYNREAVILVLYSHRTC